MCPDIFENGASFSGYGVFGNRNQSFLKNGLQTVDFFNWVFLGPCGQENGGFQKMMTSNVVDRQKGVENVTCGRRFFRKRRKKPLVFKNIRIRVGKQK